MLEEKPRVLIVEARLYQGVADALLAGGAFADVLNHDHLVRAEERFGECLIFERDGALIVRDAMSPELLRAVVDELTPYVSRADHGLRRVLLDGESLEAVLSDHAGG